MTCVGSTWHYLVLLVFSVWEFWLGKQKKLPVGSTWELIFLGVVLLGTTITSKFFKKGH